MALKFWDQRMGVTFEPIVKRYISGTWTPASFKSVNNNGVWDQQNSTSHTPNLSARDSSHKYKWGFHLISDNDKYVEAYNRIYNAFKYGDNRSYFYYQDYSSKAYYSFTPLGTYSYTYKILGVEVASASVESLRVYVGDLGLSVSNMKTVYNAFKQDACELPWKFYFDNFDSDGKYEDIVQDDATINFVCSTNSDDDAKYIYIPYYPDYSSGTYDNNGRQAMLTTIKSTFDEICSTIKSYYGITYVNQPYELNNKLYTEDQKKKISKVIHDYICRWNEYGDTGTTACYNGNQIAYNALCKGLKKPVCASYARAFAYCCWRWGITCVLISGYAGGNHMWDMVTYKPLTYLDSAIYDDSIWQEVDCTWDDWSAYDTSFGWTYWNITTAELESAGRVRATDSDVPSGYTKGNKIVSSYPAKGACSTNKYSGSTVYGGL